MVVSLPIPDCRTFVSYFQVFQMSTIPRVNKTNFHMKNFFIGVFYIKLQNKCRIRKAKKIINININIKR